MANKRFSKAYLEITNVCNLNCSFCPKTDRAAHFMTDTEASAALDALVGYTDFVYFHLMGEPLLHPGLAHLLSEAGRRGFKVMITTNGTLLDLAGDVLLSSDALHKVNISLQSFEANQHDVGLESYISMCADFARRCSAAGKLCVLRLWNKNGLETLNPEIETILRGYFPGEWRHSRDSFKLTDKVYLESGEKFDWPDMQADNRGEDLFCYGLRDQIGILCDGTVVPCCLDHNGDIPLGNIFYTGLDEILSTDRARAIYDGFSNRKAVEELCRKCGYARRFG